MAFPKIRLQVVVAVTLRFLLCDKSHVKGFSTFAPSKGGIRMVSHRQRLYVASEEKAVGSDDWTVPATDEDLLHTVPDAKFRDLCRQLNLSTKGTKQEMLMRLRRHAEEQAALEEKRRQDLKARVEQGVNEDERERHEILDVQSYFDLDQSDEEEVEGGYFYFGLPTDPNEKKEEESVQPQTPKPNQRPYRTQNDVLAPPPPPPLDAKLDEDGNRVVTVYSTTDQNDLTGIAAAQPGQAALSGTDPMSAGSSLGQPQPWDMDHAPNTKSATLTELDAAKERVTELVQTLLAMTGAPGFRHFDMPEELEDLEDYDDPSAMTAADRIITIDRKPEQRVGFDPSQVPAHLLVEASQALRANRGQVLQDVLRRFEIHAVGQDGMAADNREDGGGHFREVSKVRAFLEGYRRAEVRKAARATVTFLLDKLVSEGVDGLDLCLATMSRSTDDSTSEYDAFELNDSLIYYLDDIIREQAKKVEQLGISSGKKARDPVIDDAAGVARDDAINNLWNETKGEDGKTIQSIDPKDPRVNQILQQELENESQAVANAVSMRHAKAIPETAPEKLLLLLTSLRQRIKIEAAFGGNERSRNLRLLAYCLQCSSEADRQELIMRDLGSSIDRLDSFMELVAGSIEYAESTSHMLQPAKRMPLNVKLLRSIFDVTESIRERQAWKASGLKP